MNFAASPQGVQDAYDVVSRSVSAYRGGQAKGIVVPENA